MGCCHTKELIETEYERKSPSLDNESLIINEDDDKTIKLEPFFLSNLIGSKNICILSKDGKTDTIKLVNDIMNEFYYIIDGMIFSNNKYRFSYSYENYNELLVNVYVKLGKLRYLILDLNLTNYEHFIKTLKDNEYLLIIFITDNIDIFEKTYEYFDNIFIMSSISTYMFRKLYDIYIRQYTYLTFKQFYNITVNYKNIVISRKLRNMVNYYDFFDKLVEFDIEYCKKISKILIISNDDNKTNKLIKNIINTIKIQEGYSISTEPYGLVKYDNLDENIFETLYTNKYNKLLIINDKITTHNKNNFNIADIILNAKQYNIYLVVRTKYDIKLQSCINNSFDLIFCIHDQMNIIYESLIKQYLTGKFTDVSCVKDANCIVINNKFKNITNYTL